MDKIKLSEATHLVNRLKAMLDDEMIGCIVSSVGASIQLYSGSNFHELFLDAEKDPLVLDDDRYVAKFDGVDVVCYGGKNDRATD